MEDYSNFNGHLYTKYSNVDIIVDEGRNYLKRSPLKYDLIILNIPVTLTSQGVSGYSLVENFLLTTDSFKDYIHHLEEDGRLVIVTHNIVHTYKLITTALRALDYFNDYGIGVMSHIALVAELSPDESFYRFPTFILKNSSFTPEESKEMFKRADEIGLLPLYFPHIQYENFDPLLKYISSGNVDLKTFISTFSYDISPPSDDRPFFYKFEKSLPVSILYLFNLSLFICLLTIFLPMIYIRYKMKLQVIKRTKRKQQPNLILLILYFSLLGVAYMLIEGALIQRMILFLGHPSLSNSILLSCVLGSSGIGSIYSHQLTLKNLSKKTLMAMLCSCIVVLLYIPLVPFIFENILGLSLTYRVFISLLLLFPLGFLIGIPFPSTIRLIEGVYDHLVPWFWGLDSVFSVIGIIVAVIVALSFGFSWVLILSITIYLFAFLIFYIISF